MKASDLIVLLQQAIETHGDIDVLRYDESWFLPIESVECLEDANVQPFGPYTDDSEQYTLARSLLIG